MGDLLRLVTLDAGGRQAPVLDFNDGISRGMARDSFTFTPPPKQQVAAMAERRHGGSRQVGESHDNAQVGWSALVKGATADLVVAAVAQTIRALERARAQDDVFVEWVPDGSSRVTLFEVRGTGMWTPRYQWAMFAGALSMLVDIALPVAPLACGLPMSMRDDFTADTRGDYTYDAGVAGSEQVVGGRLLGAGTLTTERRAIHTLRGYQFVDSRQTVNATPGPTLTGFKVGRVIKRISATTYLEAYVDDDGTTSRLKLDKVNAGVRTNLKTTTLTRIVAGTPFWVKTTIVGNVVNVGYYATSTGPGPLTTPTSSTAAHTLAGSDATTYGVGVGGYYGRVWIPQDAAAAIDEESATPYVSGSITAPAVVQFGTPIPGDAPALADITIAHSGGASPPVFALLGWSERPGTGLARAPFGIFEAEAASNLSGWIVTPDATGRGGSLLNDTAATSADVYSASWEVDPSLLEPDLFEDEVSIEVWARVKLASTTVSPTFVLSLRPEDGLTFGAARYTDEWGATGRILPKPTSGTAVFRFVRLGTLRLRVDPLRPRKWLLWLAASVATGTSGAFGLDYLVAVPSRQRACSPSGVADDSGYPDFITSTAETVKTIRSNLSAMTAAPGKWGHPDHGLGGQLLELPPGQLDMVLKLSSMVPDDPTLSGTIEQLAHTVAVEMDVVPRWHLLRS